MGTKLSEYHTGYRAFSRELLAQLPLEQNSDDFLFDNQILAQILARGYSIAEVTCPTKYFPEASSINFQRSLQYGLGCLLTGIRYRLGAFRNSKLEPELSAASAKGRPGRQLAKALLQPNRSGRMAAGIAT